MLAEWAFPESNSATMRRYSRYGLIGFLFAAAVMAQDILASCKPALLLRADVVSLAPGCTGTLPDLATVRGAVGQFQQTRRASETDLANVVAAVNVLLAYAVAGGGVSISARQGDYAVSSISALIEQQWRTLVAPAEDDGRKRLLEDWLRRFDSARPRLDEADYEYFSGRQLDDKGDDSGALARYEAARRVAEALDYINLDFLKAYAGAAFALERHREAARAYEQALAETRRRAALFPEAYRAEVAEALMRCAGVCTAEPHNSVRWGTSREPNMSKEGYRMYSEAVSIYRELAAAAPARYSAGLAEALCKFAKKGAGTAAWENINDDMVPVRLFDECVAIYRSLARQDAPQYRSRLAKALTAYVPLSYGPTGKRDRGFQIDLYAEGIVIYRELAAAYPKLYKAPLARGLWGLAAIRTFAVEMPQDARAEQFELAAEHLREARGIYRELAAVEPMLYNPRLAEVRYDYGQLLYDRLKRYPEAYDELIAALELTRPLVESDAGFLRLWSNPYLRRILAAKKAAAGIGNTAVANELQDEIRALDLRVRLLGVPTHSH